MAADRRSSSEPSDPAAGGPRFHGLDGLRGVAAVVVVLTHVCLVLPSLSDAYFAPDQVRRGSPAWWFAFTPLHVLWAGWEAVYLFFVLSGFVLALPFTGSGAGRWASYFPKRLLRLYVPVWGAFVVAMLLLELFPRNFSSGASSWLQLHPADIDAAAVNRHLLLLPHGPMTLNSVLWTLRFEVMFSLLLPLVIWSCRRVPRLSLVKALALFGAIWIFHPTGLTLRFLLPMFALGTLMAFERQRLALLGQWIRGLKQSGAVWAVLTGVTVLLLTSFWSVRGLTSDPVLVARLSRVALVLTVAGACMATFLAIEGSWRSQLDRPVPRWLGKRSFSLYLVHEPLVVTAGSVVGEPPSLWLTLGIALPLSLVLAELLYRGVEHPSQRLAHHVAAAIDSRTERRECEQIEVTIDLPPARPALGTRRHEGGQKASGRIESGHGRAHSLDEHP